MGRGTRAKWEGEAPAKPITTANSEWRIVILEVSAPALPLKFSVVREHDLPVKNSQTPNEFSAQKIRHQPLAEASGMGNFRTHSEPFSVSGFKGKVLVADLTAL